MIKSGICQLCFLGADTEWHHIVYKSRCKALKDCIYNLCELCVDCHRGNKRGVHHNAEVDREVKGWLKNHIIKIGEYATIEEIQEHLGLKEKEAIMLCKPLNRINGKIAIEDLLIHIGLGGI